MHGKALATILNFGSPGCTFCMIDKHLSTSENHHHIITGGTGWIGALWNTAPGAPQAAAVVEAIKVAQPRCKRPADSGSSSVQLPKHIEQNRGIRSDRTPRFENPAIDLLIIPSVALSWATRLLVNSTYKIWSSAASAISPDQVCMM